MADKPSEIAGILSRAADRLEKPGAWTQNKAALDANSRKVRPTDPRATCWCLEGAIEAETGVSWLSDEFEELPAVQFFRDEIADGWPLYAWNDRRGRTQAEVVAALRAAAHQAEANQ